MIMGESLRLLESVRLALNMKGIPYTTKWVNFFEIEPEMRKLGLPPNEGAWMDLKYTVPTIYDPNTQRAVTDSHKINTYLEDQYPDTFPLFPKGTRALQAAFDLTYGQMLNTIFPSIVFNIYSTVCKQDKAYFRTTREAWFGDVRLEDIAPKGEKLEEIIKAWEKLLGDIGGWIDAGGPGAGYFGGDAPVQADVDIVAMLMFLTKIAPADHSLVKSLETAGGGRWRVYLGEFSKWTARSA
jgi:glutathione S-transferase